MEKISLPQVKRFQDEDMNVSYFTESSCAEEVRQLITVLSPRTNTKARQSCLAWRSLFHESESDTAA